MVAEAFERHGVPKKCPRNAGMVSVLDAQAQLTLTPEETIAAFEERVTSVALGGCDTSEAEQ
ncbi:unnamed protein product, partial [Amoebophrya sp. A120]|eukprot:GSA120T00003551001.1